MLSKFSNVCNIIIQMVPEGANTTASETAYRLVAEMQNRSFYYTSNTM